MRAINLSQWGINYEEKGIHQTWVLIAFKIQRIDLYIEDMQEDKVPSQAQMDAAPVIIISDHKNKEEVIAYAKQMMEDKGDFHFAAFKLFDLLEQLQNRNVFASQIDRALTSE
jgi:hypothetical protein